MRTTSAKTTTRPPPCAAADRAPHRPRGHDEQPHRQGGPARDDQDHRAVEQRPQENRHPEGPDERRDLEDRRAQARGAGGIPLVAQQRQPGCHRVVAKA